MVGREVDADGSTVSCAPQNGELEESCTCGSPLMAARASQIFESTFDSPSLLLTPETTSKDCEYDLSPCAMSSITMRMTIPPLPLDIMSTPPPGTRIKAHIGQETRHQDVGAACGGRAAVLAGGEGVDGGGAGLASDGCSQAARGGLRGGEEEKVAG